MSKSVLYGLENDDQQTAKEGGRIMISAMFQQFGGKIEIFSQSGYSLECQIKDDTAKDSKED